MTENKKRSVLIVDDSELNITALTQILSDDYIVYATPFGSEAMIYAVKHKPCVIILDIIMADVDGYEALKLLKSHEFTKEIPVIFITAMSKPEDEERGLALGAADYITKPFSPAIVKLRIRNQMQILEQINTIVEKEICEQSNRAKSDFISRMSHEMRTPMMAIVGMTKIAKGAEDAEKREDCFKKIEVASRYLLRLINDTLDIGDIEKKYLKLDSFAFSLEKILENAIENVKADFEDKQQVFTCNLDSRIPDVLIGDGKRLTQVVYSILSNAGKFTKEQGKIHITVSLLNDMGSNLKLQFEIIDNGIGISKEKQKTMFNTFEQVDGSMTRLYEGAGLGLAISKHIIEMMGGEIEVDSSLGNGTKIAFTCLLECERDSKTARRVLDIKGSFSGKTALLVEDTRTNRVVMQDALAVTGLEIDCAENGLKAVEMFKAAPERYDIILMDLRMPVMNGWESTRCLRGLSLSNSKTVPILAVTAHTKPDDLIKCEDVGMNGCVSKPFDFDELFQKMSEYLIPRD